MSSIIESKLTIPPMGEHGCTLIWLPGLGETAQTWKDTFETHPVCGMKAILLTSKKRLSACGDQVIAWFDSSKINDDPVDAENAKNIDEVKIALHKLVEDELASGTSPKNVFLGGVASGGTMALYAAVTFPLSLGGVVSPKAWLVRRDVLTTRPASNYRIPIWLMRGNCDLKIDDSEVNRFGLNVTINPYQGDFYSAVTDLEPMFEFISVRVQQ